MAGFDPWGWAAFGPSKWALVSTLVLAALALLLSDSPVALHRMSLWFWLTALGLAAASSLNALDPVYAWIGTPDRHLGWVALLFFAVAFVIGQNSLTQVQFVTRGVVLGGIAVGIYCLLELAGLPLVSLVSDSSRLGGTFGSPAYLGAACVLAIPIATSIALDRTQGIPWRLLSVLAAVLDLIAIVGSQTRGAWVGLIAAALLALPLWWPTIVHHPALVVVGLAGLMLVAFLTPVGSRVSVLFEGEGRGRVDEWRMGAAVFARYPVLGTGPEGYRIAFPTVVDADYERRYRRVVTPDRSHNGALDTGATLGIPGLVLYVAAVGFLVVRASRTVRGDIPVLIGVGASVVGYLVQQQFLFPLAEIDPIFWLLSGLLVTATNRTELSARRVPRWTAIPILTLAGAALFAGALDVAADRRVLSSYRLLEPSTYAIAVGAADDATRLRPDSIRYWFVASDVIARPGDEIALTQSLLRINRALVLSPADPTLRSRHAQLLLAIAEQTGDSADVTAAVAAFDRLAEEDPFNAQNWLRAGTAYALAGHLTDAEHALVIAQDLAPGSAVPSANLARVWLAAGEPLRALVAYENARTIDPDLADLSEIADLLRRAGMSVTS